MRAAWRAGDTRSRLRNQNSLARLVFLSREIHREFRELQIFFRMQWREKQSLGSVVKALSAGPVRRKRRADIEMNVEQILHGVGVLIAIQPSQRRGSRDDSSRAGSFMQSIFGPPCESLAQVERGSRRALGRHLTCRDPLIDADPAPRVGLKARCAVELVNVEAGGWRFSLVAVRAILLQKRVSLIERVTLGRSSGGNGHSDQPEHDCRGNDRALHRNGKRD